MCLSTSSAIMVRQLVALAGRLPSANLSEPDDALKIGFTLDAVSGSDPFAQQGEVPLDVRAAIDWHAARTPVAVIRDREACISRLEKEAAALWYACVQRCSCLAASFYGSGAAENVTTGCRLLAQKSGTWPLQSMGRCLNPWPPRRSIKIQSVSISSVSVWRLS